MLQTTVPRFAPLLALLVVAGCDPAPSQDVPEETLAAPEDIGTANSCRKPPRSCDSSRKCCSGAVCLNDDLNGDDSTPRTCRPCGGNDQLCCGEKRAQSLKDLAKRCTARNTSCSQGESSDFCEPCGLRFQSCCLDRNGTPTCRDGSTCQRIGPGGPGQDAFPGMCL